MIDKTFSQNERSGESTRQVILRALKTSGGASIAELADHASVSPVSVRHHLSSLQADGLVTVRTEQRRSVGRPRHIYSLSESGEELFPRQYLGLAKRLLEQVKANVSPEIVAQLFESMAEDILSRYHTRLEGASQAERLELLTEILESEGFVVSWEERGGKLVVTGHSCPYRNLGREHRDVCSIDHILISKVLGAPAKRTSCRLLGADQCAYTVSI